jgi:hypothetical protein
MSLKEKYIEITKKHFGGPNSNEMIKKIGQSAISSIMRGSDIGASVASKVAKELNITMEELIAGNITSERKGKESQINKSKEGRKMEGKLYDVEGLNQERVDILQEMIDNWKVEDTNKRKEERRKRASKSESKKSKSA